MNAVKIDQDMCKMFFQTDILTDRVQYALTRYVWYMYCATHGSAAVPPLEIDCMRAMPREYSLSKLLDPGPSQRVPQNGAHTCSFSVSGAPIWRMDYRIMMKEGKGQNVKSYDKLSTNVTRSHTVSECDKTCCPFPFFIITILAHHPSWTIESSCFRLIRGR